MTSALSSLPLDSGATKACAKCGETKPVPAFERLSAGHHRGTCKACRVACSVARRQQARAAWKETPAYKAHLERKQREREAREAAKEYARAQREAEREATWQAEREVARAADAARRRKRADRKRGIGLRPPSPERRQEIAARVEHLVALLNGCKQRERIATDEGWESVSSELQKLWLQSGEKECVSCRQMVPPERMLPPGPGNSHPGYCRSCAAEAYERYRKDTFGPLPGGRRIPMRDGTTISIGELAHRHRERAATYRLTRFFR